MRPDVRDEKQILNIEQGILNIELKCKMQECNEMNAEMKYRK
jgi:hypothetical protein